MRFNAKNVPTIVKAYAPTDVADSSAKDEFFKALDGILRDIPGRDKILVIYI